MLDKRVAESFRDKGCVVTGAASGIGLAVSEALLESGANVFMAESTERAWRPPPRNLPHTAAASTR